LIIQTNCGHRFRRALKTDEHRQCIKHGLADSRQEKVEARALNSLKRTRGSTVGFLLSHQRNASWYYSRVVYVELPRGKSSRSHLEHLYLRNMYIMDAFSCSRLRLLHCLVPDDRGSSRWSYDASSKTSSGSRTSTVMQNTAQQMFTNFVNTLVLRTGSLQDQDMGWGRRQARTRSMP
jgi:hypothetical protein